MNMMTRQETKRLLAFQWAKNHSFKPSIRITSRRSAKSMSNATGQKFLKNGRIVSEVSLERVFVQYK